MNWSNRPKFQFCWGYGGVRILALFFLRGALEGNFLLPLHNPGYLSEEAHPPPAVVRLRELLARTTLAVRLIRWDPTTSDTPLAA